MGKTYSSERYGAKCHNCERALPPNDFKFDNTLDHGGALGLYIFFDESSDGKRIYKYCRGVDRKRQELPGYWCLKCFSSVHSDQFKDLVLHIAGRGTIYDE